MPVTFDAPLACGSADMSRMSHTRHQHLAESQRTYRGSSWGTPVTSFSPPHLLQDGLTQGPHTSKMKR